MRFQIFSCQTTHANNSFSNPQCWFAEQKQLKKGMVYKWFERWLSYHSQNFDFQVNLLSINEQKEPGW